MWRNRLRWENSVINGKGKEENLKSESPEKTGTRSGATSLCQSFCCVCFSWIQTCWFIKSICLSEFHITASFLSSALFHIWNLPLSRFQFWLILCRIAQCKAKTKVCYLNCLLAWINMNHYTLYCFPSGLGNLRVSWNARHQASPCSCVRV